MSVSFAGDRHEMVGDTDAGLRVGITSIACLLT